MKSMPQDRATQSDRVAALVKDRNNVPPPTRPPRSAAVMLNQPAKKSKKADAPAVLRHLAVQKLNHAKSGLCSSPSKLPDDALNRENKLHPLASTFNDTTQTYRSAIYAHTVQRLDQSLSHFLTKLHGSNTATGPSLIYALNLTGSPQKIAIADQVDQTNRNAEKLFRRVGSYNVLMGRNGDRTEKTLDDGLTEFATRHRTRFEELHALEKKWEIVVAEIWKVSVSCLGQGTTLDMLMQRPLSALPTHDEQGVLKLGDSEPKPSHKKVKFHTIEPDPQPDLPKFLSAEMVQTEILRPTKFSEQTTRNLESKINSLGTRQIREFVSIEKESKHSWAKKLRGVLHLLQDE